MEATQKGEIGPARDGEQGARLRSVIDVLGAVARIDQSSVRFDLETLLAIRTWAIDRIGIDYAVGDNVTITTDLVHEENGWWPHREALRAGATGLVTAIEFNKFSDGGRGMWHAHLLLDRDWSVDREGVHRYWCGRADETPEGYHPPSPYDQEHHPEGRRHTFGVDARLLAKSGHFGGSGTA